MRLRGVQGRCTVRGARVLADEIAFEVVFALPDMQALVALTGPAGTTVAEAIAMSGIDRQFPDEQLDALPTGIWGRPVERDQRLADGDRVEIYRPLEIDPREARRRLAQAGLTMATRDKA